MRKIVITLVAGLFGTSAAFAADGGVGKTLYDTRCASCHGNLGEADGPVGKAMAPGLITNLKKGPFKFATDEAKIKELVTKGGAGVGLSPLMPPQGGISDSDMAELAKYVMAFRK